MTKYNAYHLYNSATSITKLASLCLKILKLGKTINILASYDKSQEISKAFWNMHYFVPHGIQGDEHEQNQLILIIYDYSNIHPYRDVFINFEDVFILDADGKDIVLWDCKNEYEGFTNHYI